MANGSIATAEPGAEVLGSLQEQEAARGQLLHEQYRNQVAEARMERDAGFVPAGGSVDAALELPDVGEPETVRGQLNAERARSATARGRIAQVQQVAQAAKQVEKTVQGVSWTIRIGLLLLNPITWFVILATPILITVGYCAQPANVDQCNEQFEKTFVNTIQALFSGGAGVKTPTETQTSADAAAGGASTPASSQDSGASATKPGQGPQQ